MSRPRRRIRTLVRVAVGVLIAGTIFNSPALASTDMPPLAYFDVPRPGIGNLSYLADDGVRAVVAIGDIAAADTVAVLVPGVGTTRGSVGDTQDSIVAGKGLVAQAETLYGQMLADQPGARVAVVAWLGYSPVPFLTPLALDRTPADEGAPALNELTESLRPGAQLTWICHSYGTLVCARAAAQAPADEHPANVILLGSPGTDLDSAASFGSTKVWAATAPNDVVGLMPEANTTWLHELGLTFGPSPTSPAFGAEVISLNSGGHFDYLTPGSQSVQAASLISLGLFPTDQPGALP